ncbi:MAG: cation:proton antiporter [Phycisphaerales bacterium]
MFPVLLAEAAQSRTVLDLVVVLAAAALGAMVARRLNLPVIASYLITGAIIGPTALKFVGNAASIEAISAIATILLMFTIGLHMDVDGLSSGMIRVVMVGFFATTAAALALWPITAISSGAPGGLAVAMALAMSSTAVVVRLMAERRETHKTHGRLIFGTLIVQDLLALAALAILPLLAAWAGATPKSGSEAAHASLLPEHWPHVVKAAVAITGIATLIGVSRLLLPSLLKEAGRGSSSEVALVLSAAVALGSAIVAAGLGFSPELGAFLAGFVLATTPFKHQLAGQLAPMRDLFMAVFFTSVGLQLKLTVVRDDWLFILLSLVALLSIKAVANALIAWIFGATAVIAALFGLALCQAGEFSIVILALANALGLTDDATRDRLIAVVVLGFIVTPSLYSLGHRIAPFMARFPVAGWSSAGALRRAVPVTLAPAGDPAASPNPEPAPKLANYVIIAGFGIVGRSLADRLEVAGIPFCIVDLNQQTIATQRRLGRSAYYGDISNPEVLESAGIDAADAVFLTIPDDEATLRACRVVRTLAPHIFIAARTSFLSKAMVATELGADQVIVEEVATAETMARQVIERLERRRAAGVPRAST